MYGTDMSVPYITLYLLPFFPYYSSMNEILTKKKNLLIFRIIAACIGIFGLVYRLVFNPLYVEGTHNHLYQLGFWSVQSFIYITLIFVFLVINQIRGKEESWPTPPFRGSALLYGLITSILFGAFFAHTFNVYGFNRVVLFSNHLLMPLLIMIDNIVSIPARSYRFDLLIYWMIYPLYYLIFTIYESFIVGVNRYYFLVFDDANKAMYPYILFLMGIMFVICAALIIFINKIYKSSEGSGTVSDERTSGKHSGGDR